MLEALIRTTIRWNPVSEVGFENFRITSEWGDPNGVFGKQTFVHHLSALMDYGWQALFIQHARDSWVRNMVFDSLSGVLRFDNCMQSVAMNNIVQGKSGHSSFLTTQGYGNMFRCECGSLPRPSANVHAHSCQSLP